MSEEQSKKFFLIGTIGIGALVIIGLVWAIASGPGNSGVSGTYGFDDANDPVFGLANVSTVVRIYGDFQCPACRVAEPNLQYAKSTYGDRVKFVWNDFPIQAAHPNALSAAIAARCAEDQGKFWEYHDRLYADQPAWDTLPAPTEKFMNYADALGLRKEDFAACLSSKKDENKIMHDLDEGDRIGITATPTFFIGNKMIIGDIPKSRWDSEIRSLIGTP